MKKHFRLFILALVLLVVSGCTVTKISSSDDPPPPPASDKKISANSLEGLPAQAPPAIDPKDISAARNTPVVRAALKVGPSVVGITNKAYARDMYNRPVMIERGAGSGVIFDDSGLIVTNFHVVDSAEELVVSLADGRSFPGRVIGGDEATDLAVVKINADNLPIAEFGDSDSLLVGEPTIVIGNPLGLEFRGSVTTGVISALNRTLDIGERRFRLIQTDAPINPGNSGGALLNADGMLIGINSSKVAVSGVEGIGFAIPINTVKPIVKALIKDGRVIRPYLGVGLVDREIAARYGYDLDLTTGIYVAKVYSDTPAANAGIRSGDIILSINGQAIKTNSDIREVLDKLSIGTTVGVDILRNGKTITLNVVLTEMPVNSRI